MAPVKGATHTTLTYNSNALTSKCNQVDLQATLDNLEVTNLGSTGKEYLTGTTEWTIRMQGYWDATADSYLGPDVVSPGTKRTAAIAFNDGTTTVTYTWTSNAEIANMQWQAQPSGAITFTAELRLSGAPTRSTA